MVFFSKNWLILALGVALFTSPDRVVHAQSKGPGPRAAHCVVEHAGTVYFLAGTPPTDPSYASFTSLALPLNSFSAPDPDTLPWKDLPNPPQSLHINNLTMTFSTANPNASPSWVDCFATDDGRIVAVGGGRQLMVYTIGSASWADVSLSMKYGPSVSSGPFLNPVYLQARVLADGFTALVVCTLNWNSQPQPYYLDTNTWTITLAIGTALTTPPASSSTSSGWGIIPGGGTPLPPPGFRHYTLAILGQDKHKRNANYGNGRAYLIGGYSTLVTGQVKDWDTITSFPVQQQPSNVVIMFGNSGALPKATRGSTAYPVSMTTLAIFPGNGGTSDSSNTQAIQQYDVNQNAVSVISSANTAKNSNRIFRGATRIGQGDQIFSHGGLSSLEFGPTYSPPLVYLDRALVVWNGASQTWGDVVAVFVDETSKGLMIGLIVGGVVLLIMIGVGTWMFFRRRKNRALEEEERQAKGLALKNEDMLQNDHKPYGSHGGNNGGAYYDPSHYHHAENDVREPLRQPHQTYAEDYSGGRNSSVEINHYPFTTQASYEPVVGEAIEMHIPEGAPGANKLSRTAQSPQEYPAHGASSQMVVQQGASPAAIAAFQKWAASSTAIGGNNETYGIPSYGIAKQEYHEARSSAPSTPVETASYPTDGHRLDKLRFMPEAESNPSAPTDTRRALLQAVVSSSDHSPSAKPSMDQSRASLGSDTYFGARPYSSSSNETFPLTVGQNTTPSTYMSSPSFSATYSLPDSVHGTGSDVHPSPGVQYAHKVLSPSSPTIPYGTRPQS